MKDFKTLIIAGIIVAVLILLALGMEWLKSERAAATVSPGVPYDLVTTFKGDASTSRAFTWYTGDPGTAGWLEAAEGGAAAFSTGTPLKIQADNTVIQTDLGQKGVHKAEIRGLAPGTLYAYRVGSGAEGEWSQVFEFRTAEADSSSVTFINVTDSQGVTLADFRLCGARP